VIGGRRGVRRRFGLGIALSAMAFTCGCAVQPPPAAPSRAERPRRPAAGAISASERAMLRRYARERGCAGAAYSQARDYAVAKLNALASAPTEAGHIGDAFENGQFRIRLAQAAAQKRCYEVASRTYGEVIDVFTGPPYSALRGRATTGLTSLRRNAPAEPRARTGEPSDRRER
jgi:hypothetical protein